MSNQPYVLGTGDDELARLALQHRLWADAAHAAWKLAGVLPGASVIDVGCGPGFASCDMAELVGARGRILGVDESDNFIAHLNSQAAARSLPQLSGVVGDVQNLSEVAARDGRNFDVAWLRWVLCFVPDPAAVVQGVASLIRPGGRVVIHDYFNYHTMTMAPRRPAHDKAVAATIASWKSRGGDPDIAGRLPRLLAAAGLRTTHIQVHSRIAHGGEPMYAWPDVWWHTYAAKLVSMGLLNQDDCDELLRDLVELRTSRTDFIQCPPVYEILAEKSEAK